MKTQTIEIRESELLHPSDLLDYTEKRINRRSAPAQVRRILANPKTQKRANWVGALYQPESWTERNPDPAVVVEWKDLPGQYFALAVWGADYHRIMEFVD